MIIAYYIDLILFLSTFFISVMYGFKIINIEGIVNKKNIKNLFIQIKNFLLKSKWISLPLFFSVLLLVISSILVTINNFEQHSYVYKFIIFVITLLCILLPILIIIIAGIKISELFSQDFIMDKLLNAIRGYLFVVPLIYIFLAIIIFEFIDKINLNYYTYILLLKSIYMILCIAQLIIIFILIYYGIRKCMLYKLSINPGNKERTIFETKIIIIITWFIILFLNSTAIIYITSKWYPNTFSSSGIINSAYFALITLLTIGFGDVLPNSSLGKILISMIALMGAYLMIVGVAGILSSDEQNTNDAKNLDVYNEFRKVSDEIKKYQEISIGGNAAITQIKELEKMKKKGILSEKEYKRMKKKLIKRFK